MNESVSVKFAVQWEGLENNFFFNLKEKYILNIVKFPSAQPSSEFLWRVNGFFSHTLPFWPGLTLGAPATGAATPRSSAQCPTVLSAQTAPSADFYLSMMKGQSPGSGF